MGNIPLVPSLPHTTRTTIIEFQVVVNHTDRVEEEYDALSKQLQCFEGHIKVGLFNRHIDFYGRYDVSELSLPSTQNSIRNYVNTSFQTIQQILQNNGFTTIQLDTNNIHVLQFKSDSDFEFVVKYKIAKTATKEEMKDVLVKVIKENFETPEAIQYKFDYLTGQSTEIQE